MGASPPGCAGNRRWYRFFTPDVPSSHTISHERWDGLVEVLLLGEGAGRP